MSGRQTTRRKPMTVLDLKRAMLERDAALAEARAEVEALRHDIERHITIAAEQADEIDRLRAALRMIATGRDPEGNMVGSVKEIALEALLHGR
jgi:hypothetical protein